MNVKTNVSKVKLRIWALLLALFGAAGMLSAVEVKVLNTGRMTWNILDSGYWVEYSFDGKVFRSDTAGQRINQMAWENMSLEEATKVIEAYGCGGANARIEQFGFDGAQQLVDLRNLQNGWTDAHKKYTEALAYRDYPTHAAIFNTEQSRKTYFNENFVPNWPEGTEVMWDNEMNQIMAEQELVWNWATEAYFAVKRGNERRMDTAAKALSGDLIALITDKVLVPNITASNPIELGLNYTIRKEVLGSLFDYVNSITELGDELTEAVVGERASGDAGAELIAKVTDLINMNLHLINNCMARLRANKAEMERLGPQKAEESKKKSEELAKREEASAKAIADALDAAPVNGLPEDEAIVEACSSYEQAISSLEKQMEETDDYETWARLSKMVEEKQNQYEVYQVSILDDVEERFASWAEDCLAAIAAWTNRRPSLVYSSSYKQSFLDELPLVRPGGWLATASPLSASRARSVVSEYVQYCEAMKEAYQSWYEEGNELVVSYRNRYQEIFTDANAISATHYQGNRRADVLMELNSVGGDPLRFVGFYQRDIDSAEADLEAYLAGLEHYQDAVARRDARREELRSNIMLAAVAYEQAHESMTNLLMRLPAYLDGCNGLVTGVLEVPQDSVLRRNVFGGNGEGNAALMRQYCQEINEIYKQFKMFELRRDLAHKHVESYLVEWRNNQLGDTGVSYSTLELLPECYAKRSVLQAAVRDFNLHYREGRLLEYYVLLADNQDYYAGQRSSYGSIRKSAVPMLASVTAGELPTYAQLCRSIESLLDNPVGFADGVKGYSPQETGGVYETLIVPMQSTIEGIRDALTWDYVIEGGKAKIRGIGGVASGAVTIPATFEGCPVVELGEHLFTGSSRMTSVVIPESVVTIGDCAFSGCIRLEAVRIPAKVAHIGEEAFSGCDSLLKFEVAADNSAYRAVNGLLFAKRGTDPIAGIGGDVVVPAGVKRIGTELFFERELGSVVLPFGMEEIGERAFAYSSLREITIPASVTTIAGDAFYGCDQLVTVYVDHGDDFRVRELLRSAGVSLSRITVVGEFTETVDGVEWHYGTQNGGVVVTSIPDKPEGESYGKVVVPSTLGGLPVTAIGNSVFMWRSDITEVSIPHGVRSIGDYAFNSSPSIVAVSIPESVTTLGELTFGYSSLRTVRTVKGDAGRVKNLLRSAGLNVSVRYDESLPKGVDPVPPPRELDPDGPAMVDVTEPYAVPKATKLYGCVYDGAEVVNFIELKLGKVNAKKGTSKISASVTDVNGKRFSAKSVTVSGITGTAPATVTLTVSKLGTMTLKIGGAKFAGTLNGLQAQIAPVGDEPVGKAEFGFVGGAPDLIKGIAIEQGLLPEGEPIDMQGKRWNFAKAASVAYKKDRATGEYGWVINGGKPNPLKTNMSGLKLSYSSKKAFFKGSFKAYGLDRKGKNPRLKKFTVKVSGFFVDGAGNGIATVKNEGTWKVEIR